MTIVRILAAFFGAFFALFIYWVGGGEFVRGEELALTALIAFVFAGLGFYFPGFSQ